MNERFHIIIAGDQRKARSFSLPKQGILLGAALLLVLTAGTISAGLLATRYHDRFPILTARLNNLSSELATAEARTRELQQQLTESQTTHKQEIARIHAEDSRIIARLQLESSNKISALEKINTEQQTAYEEDRNTLLSSAVNDLNERSEFIEEVIKKIGFKVKTRKTDSQKNTGGPFVAAKDGRYDDLLFKTDRYLKALQTLPLGRPATGTVSSWYGKRIDPINGKSAFHEGIDFRGKVGSPIRATADGKVTFAGTQRGYGNVLIIDHGNGYTTKYAHLHKFSVKKGDYVTRGQNIGQIGNSGRSTGPHLHYEIAYKGKTVNPAKFMKITSLACDFTTKK